MATANDRRIVLLLLLYVPGPKGTEAEPIRGRTRLQKLLFLAKEDYGLGGVFEGFPEFEPYKYGPFSSELYDDLDFLENLGLITTRAREVDLAPKQNELVDLSGLFDEESQLAPTPDIEETRRSYDYALGEDEVVAGEEMTEEVFKLTQIGKERAKRLIDQVPAGQRDRAIKGLQAAKTRFGGLPLRQLLRYVYRRYSDMTTRSEIAHLY